MSHARRKQPDSLQRSLLKLGIVVRQLKPRRANLIAGAPLYMAPKQAMGKTLDYRADLLSLGSAPYQLVTGRPPFHANSTLAVIKRVADDTPRPIREIIPDTPQWLCDVIETTRKRSS